MVERQMELRRRYHRKKKMAKLKARLGEATGEVREKLIYKIKCLSPWWTEASLTQTHTSEKTAPEKTRSASRPKAPARGPKGKPSN